MISVGIEPTTFSLRGSCSAGLSYKTISSSSSRIRTYIPRFIRTLPLTSRAILLYLKQGADKRIRTVTSNLEGCHAKPLNIIPACFYKEQNFGLEPKPSSRQLGMQPLTPILLEGSSLTTTPHAQRSLFVLSML